MSRGFWSSKNNTADCVHAIRLPPHARGLRFACRCSIMVAKNARTEGTMRTSEFFKKWYAAFAPDVDPDIMRERVCADGCCPWHIFTWGKVACMSGEDAIAAFRTRARDDVFCYVGADYANGVHEVRKNDLAGIARRRRTGDEIYITALDFFPDVRADARGRIRPVLPAKIGRKHRERQRRRPPGLNKSCTDTVPVFA